MKELIEKAKKKGFFVVSDIRPCESEDQDYLWMCLLQKWLLDTHKIWVLVNMFDDFGEWYWCLDVRTNTALETLDSGYGFESQPKALEVGLLKALGLIKEILNE